MRTLNWVMRILNLVISPLTILGLVRGTLLVGHCRTALQLRKSTRNYLGSRPLRAARVLSLSISQRVAAHPEEVPTDVWALAAGHKLSCQHKTRHPEAAQENCLSLTLKTLKQPIYALPESICLPKP